MANVATNETNQAEYPSAALLVEQRAASRVHAKDASLYAFSEQARACAERFMGWTDLASCPPYPVEEIQAFAREQLDAGLETVVLVAQGGSSQAAMTMTKFAKTEGLPVTFFTLDSLSPVRFREMLAKVNPATTLVLASSKSGSTIEMRTLLAAVRDAFSMRMPAAEMPRHLVAVTDPGSALEAQAREEGWLAVFPGVPTVGGRFSALSTFGLVPAALAGIDVAELLEAAAGAEERCAADTPDNPAVQLAAFLYDNYTAGRDKLVFFTQKRCRALGLWIEQLVAESLGKDGKGILPGLEVDPLLLAAPAPDRMAVACHVPAATWDENRNFARSLSCIHPDTPVMECSVATLGQLVEQFVVWEHAVALCGYLMEVCPFDQPDVEVAKVRVRGMLADGGVPASAFTQETLGGLARGAVGVDASPCLQDAQGPGEGAGEGASEGVSAGASEEPLARALQALFASIEPGDYFALNAFLPFTGEGRREALEDIRHQVAQACGVFASLEVGSRYLHSTGQLQKGGPNTGVFLVVSADEFRDVRVDGLEAPTLGTLAHAQAAAEMAVLAERGRRCVHVHLPDNGQATLRCLGREVARALAAVR